MCSNSSYQAATLNSTVCVRGFLNSFLPSHYHTAFSLTNTEGENTFCQLEHMAFISIIFFFLQFWLCQAGDFFTYWAEYGSSDILSKRTFF